MVLLLPFDSSFLSEELKQMIFLLESTSSHSTISVYCLVHGRTTFYIQENSSVQFSLSVVSNSLRPHELQQARPPSPSPTPRVYPNSCSLSWWHHPTISSSVICFSPALNLSEYFEMSHQGLFKWVKTLIQVAKVLEFQLQHQSFQWTPRTDLL